ncbi:hypothetical protein M885DRAFT_508357 [Pelagophyceae sp. CCMP2097]|nr:hypothetical protein M885DRAFT_508357 [Pelagophyceae sp. CCMP2097]
MFTVGRGVLIQGMVMIVPGAILFAIMQPNKLSRDELHAELERKYPQQIKLQRENRAQMQEFFQKMKDNDPEQEATMRALMNQPASNKVKPTYDQQYAKKRPVATEDRDISEPSKDISEP